MMRQFYSQDEIAARKAIAFGTGRRKSEPAHPWNFFFIAAMFWALVILIMLARASLPEGMHLATYEVRVDTIIYPCRTPARAWVDSVMADTLKKEHKKWNRKKSR
jgi:hypothetical protein